MRMKCFFVTFVLSVFFLGILLTSNNALGASQDKPVKLKMIRAWQKDTKMYDSFWQFVEKVNSRSKGRLIIEDVGGPEVSPAFEQLGMLKAGLVDLVVTVPAYIAGVFPEVNAFYFNFGSDLRALREAGVFTKLSEIARDKTGSIILGGYFFGNFHAFLTKKIENIQGFRTLKLRSLTMYDPVFKGLGASTVTVSPAETYTALERGVVDGLGWPDVGFVDFGYHEIIKYIVSPAFWRYPSGFICMRAKVYDALPSDLKDILDTAMKEVEEITPSVFMRNALKDREVMKRSGMQEITLSEEDWKTTQRIHWEQGVKSLLLDPCPKYGQELKELMSQFYPPKEVYVYR